MSDTTGGKAGDDEDSPSESSFGSSVLCCGGDSVVSQCRLVFQVEDDSQDHRGAEQIPQIDDAADCAGSLDLTCMKCNKRVSVIEHLHNLSPRLRVLIL